MATEFEKYFKTAGWNGEYMLIAQSAWDAAIEKAVEKVKENFDEMEPWITPEEIAQLFS